MAWIKLKTDCFINPKVRRLSDGAFRIWVYLLAQAWEEGPGKPAGLVRVKGVQAPDEEQALDKVAFIVASAAGTDDESSRSGHLNECENVGLIHTITEEVGTTVGTTGTCPNRCWDIELSMHDWAHHNPRQPPSHTTEGEAERKRKYRESIRDSSTDRPKRPKAAVPSVPTPDKDLDRDQEKDRDPDSQPAGLTDLASALGHQLGWAAPLGLGKDPVRTRREFARWLLAVGPQETAMECLRLANEKGEKPRHLSWFVGWLETVPDSRLRRSVQ